MTSLEHALIGIHSALALGLQRRVGWSAVACAGAASVLPDWDGLPMLFDMARFEPGHRVWGHSLLVMAGTSLLLALVLVRWDWIGKWVERWGRRPSEAAGTSVDQSSLSWGGLTIASAFLIAFVAQGIHIPCDMVVASGQGLANWPVQPWWPFSRNGYVFPMVPWGDPSATVILMSGVIVQARRRSDVCLISIATLGILVAYLVVRRCL
jgi:membrane-bound metal-dependent hydrolase YbcI (DUF457 family)